MKKRDITIISLGNIIEWFDFGLLIFLAPVIGKQFFPTNNSITTSIATVLVFTAGFLCRPFGGILFGQYGDTHGRSKTLRISFLMVTFTTLSIGFIPSYQSIGLLAPFLFMIIRMLQGVSIGGEYSGVMIYLAESAPEHRRGFITSFAAVGANTGFLFAILIVILLKNNLSVAAMSEWGWRLSFILAGGFGAFIFYYRLQLSETPVYQNLRSSKCLEHNPLLNALKFEPGNLLRIMGLTSMSATFYYFIYAYIPIYLTQQLNINANNILIIQCFSLISMILLVPFAGLCGDRFGRKRILILTAIAIIIFLIPCFYLLASKNLSLIALSFCIAALLSSMEQGNTLTVLVESFPANVRYSSIAFSYNIGMTLFGGTVPLILFFLTKNIGNNAAAYYLIMMAIISLISIITLRVNP